MRGLLGFLIVAVLALGALAAGVQVVLPAVVTAAVRSSIGATGAAPVDVAVVTSLDGMLFHGWIDEVTISGGEIRHGPVSVEDLTATLTDVSLADRSFADLAGSLSGVELELAEGGSLRISRMALTGSSSQVTAVGRIDPDALASALAIQLRAQGVTPSEVRVKDGAIQLAFGSESFVADLVVRGGGLVLELPATLGRDGGRVRIVDPPADGSWRLAGLRLAGGGAELTVIVGGSTLTEPP